MMRTTSSFIFVAVCLFQFSISEEEQVFKVAGLDSYLEAYRESQEANPDNSVNSVEIAVKKSDREFSEWASYPPFNGYNQGPQ